MLRVLSRAALVALATLVLPLACSDSPTAPAGDEARMVLTASVVGTPIATLVVEVTAADISVPIVTNLTVIGGIATGTLRLPPGEDRTITVRAFDDQGQITHEGTKTVDVARGTGNPAVSIPMVARSGQVPITVQIGPVSIVVTPSVATVPVDGTLPLTAVITAPNGEVLAIQPEWATTNPAFATVNGSGVVTGMLEGVASIVATYAGVAAISQVTVTPSEQTYVVSGTWSCASGVSCQDVYDIELPAATEATVTVTSVTGSSVLRLGAFAPGVALSGANLMTGMSRDRQCGGQNAGDAATIKSSVAGTYRFAVGRAWGPSAGSGGTYTLTVTTTQPMNVVGQTVEDQAGGLADQQCGFTFTVTSGWTCGSGISCHDRYELEALSPTPITITVNEVTGLSVVRLAVLQDVGGTFINRLNGIPLDRMCAFQDVGDFVSTVLPTGTHPLNVGRDWGSSAGSFGTYRLTVETPNAPLVAKGQVLNDAPPLFLGTTCP